MDRYAISKTQGTRNSTYTRSKGISFYNLPKYPVIPLSDNDVYAITEWGDRFDNIAFQFYGDTTLWWIISTANPNIAVFNSIFIPVGSQIRIPQNIGAILDNYNAINR
tara:strand:- start:2296 stop:2619 length:324 start_codon:yes stop_codon:yes gene_type:complete